MLRPRSEVPKRIVHNGMGETCRILGNMVTYGDQPPQPLEFDGFWRYPTVKHHMMVSAKGLGLKPFRAGLHPQLPW